MKKLFDCRNCNKSSCEYPRFLKDWTVTGEFENIPEEEFDSIVKECDCKIYTHTNGRRFIIKYVFMNSDYDVFYGIEYID